jgi:AcrR family transcriptional regulator
MPTTKPRKPRGRPPVHTPEEQMERIIEAAEQLLAQREMDAHSMTEIARQAGMSKRTVYALVSSKEVLIERVMARVGVAILGFLETDITSAKQAVGALERFLLRWMQAALVPTTINLFRLVLDERKNFPDVAKNYFASGNTFIRGKLAEWIDVQVSRKYLAIAEPAFFVDVAADYLVIRPLLGMALNADFKDSALSAPKRVARIMSLFAM